MLIPKKKLPARDGVFHMIAVSVSGSSWLFLVIGHRDNVETGAVTVNVNMMPHIVTAAPAPELFSPPQRT